MSYRTLLRWAALPVTDRRWAAPLCAVALGFGLFAGVAIGPGASGTFATGVPQIIELPGFGESGGGEEGESEEPETAEAPESSSFGDEEEAGSSGIVPVTPLGEVPPSSTGEETSSKATTEEGPAEPEKQELAGTVVHVNPAASSYTVAEASGTISAVHAGKLPMAGTQIEVPIRTLVNGTLAEAGKRKKTGAKARAKLAGIVTFVDANPAAPAYAVSNKGTSALVEVHPDPAGALPTLPLLGAYATVSVDVEAPKPASASATQSGEGEVEPPPSGEPPPEAAPPASTPPPLASAPAPGCAVAAGQGPAPVVPKGTLWQRQIGAAGAPFTHADFEGIVEALCPATGQLLVSADDVREGGHDLLFTVPAEIHASKLTVGNSILAGADIAADGTLTLTGLASDERLKGADDETAVQGSLVPEKPDGQG